MALKIIFMGTPEFSVPILKSIHNSKHKILEVYTQPPKRKNRGQIINLTPIHEFSNQNKINVRCPIELNTEEARQTQFDDSLMKIADADDFDNAELEKLINCYVEIANADDFIHENEVTLIQHAIESWSMGIVVDKPKSGEKLKVKSR